MGKKKGGLEKVLFQWAYQNRKGETRAAQILKCIEETEKALDNVKFKKEVENKKLKKYKKKLAFCKSLSYNISCVEGTQTYEMRL